MFERPENVIPTAVQTWQCVLASLFPETGEEEHFQKVSKRVSLETCEKTQPGPDGPNGLSANQDSCRRIWNRQPFHVASLGYSNVRRLSPLNPFNSSGVSRQPCSFVPCLTLAPARAALTGPRDPRGGGRASRAQGRGSALRALQRSSARFARFACTLNSAAR